MTRQQLLDAQVQLDQAYQQRDIAQMLKGVVTNMHCLVKFSREAGLTPFYRACSLHLCLFSQESKHVSRPTARL